MHGRWLTNCKCAMTQFSEACLHAAMPVAMQDVKEKCRRDFLSAYAAELVFWPAFQAINFWKVPVRHQLLAVNLACLLDATFLCWCGKLLQYGEFLLRICV